MNLKLDVKEEEATPVTLTTTSALNLPPEEPQQNRLMVQNKNGWFLDAPLPNLPLRDRHLTPHEEEERSKLSPKDLERCNTAVQDAINIFSSWYPTPEEHPTPWVWAQNELAKLSEGIPTKPLLDDIETAQLLLDVFSSEARFEDTRKAAYRWLGHWRSLLRDYSGALNVALSPEVEAPFIF